MTYIIDVETVYNKLKNNVDGLILIDVRFDLSDSITGERAYNDSHLPYAHYLHIENDLSGPIQKHGGNHPLPDVPQLTEVFSEIGITNDKMVVFYDDRNDMFASRAWWLLHYLGHNNCYVLDGGFNQWKEKGYDITSDIPEKKRKTFTPHIRNDITVDVDDVKAQLTDQSTYLIDSRARERYLGNIEPLYEKAGHIPGAINYFWQDVLNEHGLWKSQVELEKHFKQFDKDAEIIVSCGSGISACPNYLSLKMLGFNNVKLYPGSFSDWISYEENEVETTEGAD